MKIINKLQTENKILENKSQNNLRRISAACSILEAIHTSFVYKFLLRIKNRSRTPNHITDEIETTNSHRVKQQLIDQTGRGTIIYPPTIEWNIPLAQRPQHMAKALADKGYLFFYCTNNIYDEVLGYRKISTNLYLTNQFLALLDSVPGAWIIFNAAHPGYNLDDLIVWKHLGFRIIYQYIDDLSPQLINPKHYAQIIKRHSSIGLNHVDLVVVSAVQLEKEMLNKFPRNMVFYIPNGVDYDHFKKKSIRPPSKIAAIVNQGKPIIGYHGALASWLDIELIKQISRARPDWNIVLIGWDFDNSEKKLHNFPNVYLPGIQSYDDIPKFVQWFDVAIIPFKKGDIAKSTSPLKLFEYMSAAKQVVVTSDMDECKGFEGVKIASNTEDFISKIEEALLLRDNIVIKSKLRQQAKDNSWKSRAKLYDKALKTTKVIHRGTHHNILLNRLLKSKLSRQGKEMELIRHTKVFKLLSTIFPNYFL